MGESATYTAVIYCEDKNTAEKLIEKFAGKRTNAHLVEAFGILFSRKKQAEAGFMVLVDYNSIIDIVNDDFPFKAAVDHFGAIYEKVLDELEEEMGEGNIHLSGEFELYPAVYGVAVPKSGRKTLHLSSAFDGLR